MTILLLAAPAAVHAEVVDRILSVVGQQLVTESDLAFEQVFSDHDRSPVPPFEDPDADLLSRLEDYRILRRLAGDIDTFRPDPQEVDLRLTAFRASWERRQDYEAFLARWNVDEAELRERLYGRMVVELYVERNVGATLDAKSRSDAIYIERYELWMKRRRAAVPIRRPDPIEP